MTVCEFAIKCLRDSEVLKGGIIKNERRYLDNIGFQYTVSDGQVESCGDDLRAFYDAISTIVALQWKYGKKVNNNG